MAGRLQRCLNIMSLLLELPSHSSPRGGLWYSTPASTRFSCHYHTELELNVVLTGAAHYRFPHREIRVVAPSALWIPPHLEHELLDASSDLSMWVHSFRITPAGASDEGCRVKALQLPDGAQALSNEPVVTCIAADALMNLCARSRDGLLRPAMADFDGVLEDLIALAWSGRRPAETEEPRACHPAALRAARLLRESGGSLSVTDLAHSSPLSRERLSRVFTQAHGIGLVQYRNHLLVQRFIHDYGHGSYGNMLHAALDAGFGSYAQFHRAFKQVTGYPPLAHLERVRRGIVDPARTG